MRQVEMKRQRKRKFQPTQESNTPNDDDGDKQIASRRTEPAKRFYNARSGQVKTISHVCALLLHHIHEMEQLGQASEMVLRANYLETALSLPRRRIYDVFHILQAIGLIRKGGKLVDGKKGYIYNGGDQVATTFASMQRFVNDQQRKHARDRRLKTTATILSSVLIDVQKKVDQQGDKSKVPALWSATQRLLMSMVAHGNSMTQRDIYKLDDDSDGTSTKSRRIYDVLAVLSTCNMIEFDTDAKFDRAKSVHLNPAMLNDTRHFSIFYKIHECDGLPRTKSEESPESPTSAKRSASCNKDQNTCFSFDYQDGDGQAGGTSTPHESFAGFIHDSMFSTESLDLQSIDCLGHVCCPSGSKLILSPFKLALAEDESSEACFAWFPLHEFELGELDV
ncbi:unnamed protein product [Aphanomyces euteiches]